MELEIGQWSDITRGIPRIMQIQLATFPILMYLACRAKLEGILDSSSTSRRYRLPRIYLVRAVSVPRIFAIQKRTIWNITRTYDLPTKSTKKSIGISIRRLEAVYSRKKFRVNLENRSNE